MNHITSWKYIPILALSPAEMTALAELPDKAKDNILPLFALKGWLASTTLDKALERIKSSFGTRPWIADIDARYLSENKTFLFTGKHPDKPIFNELKNLLNPEDAYRNWFEFLKCNKNLIPSLRHEIVSSSEEISEQIKRLADLNRGVVIRYKANETNLTKYKEIINGAQLSNYDNLTILLDFEDIDHNYNEEIKLLETFINHTTSCIHPAAVIISSTSFPANFSGQKRGSFSIYERLLYNQAEKMSLFNPLIYSDRGSARANKQEGGSGVPPPRIDYPMQKDWKFVRREVRNDIPNSKENRKAAYVEIANEIIKSDYWIADLRLWGTQQIELTAEGSDFAILTPQKSTSARINIHLFNQLNYDVNPADVDTDDEWID
ncbi:beta family protein [Pseudomonas mosselii]|uniref:beta family protein n=1 Tax=Pseudomonas mosselii TaxID=78327 RepID=UPI002DB6C12F|nr:hypothetical protein [Pseudomonas mosselii]MEB5931596.1 beta family protein [Pseudomonas mosselii]